VDTVAYGGFGILTIAILLLRQITRRPACQDRFDQTSWRWSIQGQCQSKANKLQAGQFYFTRQCLSEFSQ